MRHNLALLMDLYELTMAQCYFLYRRSARATFDLFVRGLGPRRNFLVFCGLDSVLGYIRNLKFSPEDINYLRRLGYFNADFLKFLRDFKFSGDIWAMREGEVCFAHEPLLRVTAPIIEAQILESFLLNTVNLETVIASKAARVVLAAEGRKVFDFSLRRTHGPQAALKAARSSYIAGCQGTSNVLAAKLYGMPAVGTMAHSFVMSFKHEIDSFLAYAGTFPQKTTLLVDTYNSRRGIENAVTVGLYLKEKNCRLQGIRLDSGDIVSLSRFARRSLAAAGLGFVKIFASGNLDEFKIQRLLERGAAVDYFGVGTNMGTSIDAPALDAIYKLSEITDESGKFSSVMKLSKAKVTYPARKQAYRISDRQGRFVRDILGLAGERIHGRPLLIKVVNKGKVIYQSPALEDVRSRLKESLDNFPASLKKMGCAYKYPVFISPGLKKVRDRLLKQLKKGQ